MEPLPSDITHISIRSAIKELPTWLFLKVFCCSMPSIIYRENNNGLITPSKTNIRNLFVGTQYENDVDQVLQWIHEQGIIQCAPGEMYSVQFSAFPSGEVERRRMKCAMCNSDILRKFLISLMLPVSPLNNASCSG